MPIPFSTTFGTLASVPGGVQIEHADMSPVSQEGFAHGYA